MPIGALGHLSGSPTTQTNYGNNIAVSEGNFDSLANCLLSLGILQQDVEDLRERIENDQKNNSQGIGPKALEWIKGLGQKAIESATVALAQAAVLKFFGLS